VWCYWLGFVISPMLHVGGLFGGNLRRIGSRVTVKVRVRVGFVYINMFFWDLLGLAGDHLYRQI
jgi:hypothetical protein